MKWRDSIIGGAFAAICAIAGTVLADPAGWGVPSIIAKNVTFREPAAGIGVTFDCATTTHTGDACVELDNASGTAGTVGLYVLGTQTANVNNQFQIYTAYSSVTAMTGSNNRILVGAAPRGHASDAAGTSSIAFAALPPDVDGGGSETAFQASTGYTYAGYYQSGSLSWADAAATIETRNSAGASDAMELKIANAVTSGASGDFTCTMGAGTGGADDGDWIYSHQATSQVYFNASSVANSLGAPSAPIQEVWQPSAGATRYGVSLAGDMSVNASHGTAQVYVDMDDVEGAALGSGSIISAIDIVPSFSTTDNAAAIRAGITYRAPSTASAGLDTVLNVVDGSNIVNRIIRTTSTSGLVEVPTLRGAFCGDIATLAEGRTITGAFLDSSVTMRGVTLTWDVTGTGGSTGVQVQVVCGGTNATCAIPCTTVAGTPTRCTLTVNNSADQICSFNVTTSTDCTLNPTGVAICVDYNQVP